MLNMKNFIKYLIFVIVVFVVYVVLAYVDRGYYALGLEIMFPLFVWVAYLYAIEAD